MLNIPEIFAAIEDHKESLTDAEYLDLVSQLQEAYNVENEGAACGCTRDSLCINTVLGNARLVSEAIHQCSKITELYNYCPLYYFFTSPHLFDEVGRVRDIRSVIAVYEEWLENREITCTEKLAAKYLDHFMIAACRFLRHDRWFILVLFSAALFIHKFWDLVKNHPANRHLRRMTVDAGVIRRFCPHPSEIVGESEIE